MKDIDFDELDRAVNSLMNSVPLDDNDDTEEDESVVTITNTTSDVHDEIQLAPPAKLMIVEEPEDDRVAVKPDVAEPVSIKKSPTASLPTARRGRFMDMVRPPIQESSKPISPARPSRHGPTLQPVTSMRPPAPVTKPLLEESAAMGGWLIEPTTKIEPEKIVAAAPTLTPETSPSVLPFLPDAKVEKRPLGRPVEVQTEPETVITTTPSFGSVDLVSETDFATPSVMAPEENEDAQLPGQPLPAELGSELLSIETSTEMLSDGPPVIFNKPAQPASHSLHIPGVARGSAAISIPQQYKVQPKGEPDNHEPAGAIYDTASYHQPLAHPAKKKPGWVWVVAIIVILLLGVAGGAAFYYFGLNG